MAAGPYSDSWLWTVKPEEYVCRSFGDSTFLYSRLSGTTHILNLVSSAMLEFLQEGPKTLPDVETGFHAFLRVPREECPTGVARRIFTELDDIGLLHRIEP